MSPTPIWSVASASQPATFLGLTPSALLLLLACAMLALADRVALIPLLLLLGSLIVPTRPGVWATVMWFILRLVLMATTLYEMPVLRGQIGWPTNPWVAAWPIGFGVLCILVIADKLVRRVLAGQPICH